MAIIVCVRTTKKWPRDCPERKQQKNRKKWWKKHEDSWGEVEECEQMLWWCRHEWCSDGRSVFERKKKGGREEQTEKWKCSKVRIYRWAVETGVVVLLMSLTLADLPSLVCHCVNVRHHSARIHLHSSWPTSSTKHTHKKSRHIVTQHNEERGKKGKNSANTSATWWWWSGVSERRGFEGWKKRGRRKQNGSNGFSGEGWRWWLLIGNTETEQKKKAV